MFRVGDWQNTILTLIRKKYYEPSNRRKVKSYSNSAFKEMRSNSQKRYNLRRI